MGQLLIRMVRHRDSGGRDAQLRASLGIRELTHASKANNSLEIQEQLKKKSIVENARQRQKNGGSVEEDNNVNKTTRDWQSIKSNFLQKHMHRKKEMADSFGAHSMLLDTFEMKSQNLKKTTKKTTEMKNTGNYTSSGVAACSQKISNTLDNINENSEKIINLGNQLMTML